MRPHRLALPATLATALVLAAPAAAGIHGSDGKLAFESDRAGTADIWITTGTFGDPPGPPVEPILGNSPSHRDARPAWAPPPAVQPAEGWPFEVQPGDEVRFLVRGAQPGWEITVRWPGLPGEQPILGIDGFGVVSARVPTGAQTGKPCLSIMNKAVVEGWPARMLAQGDPTTVRDPGTNQVTPLNDDTIKRCEQPLAFQSDREAGWDIFVYEPMSGEVRNLTPNTPTTNETAPAWSSQLGTGVDPSSDRVTPLLAFARGGDIYVLDPLAGGAPVNVTNSAADESNPDWSSDASSLVFEREQGGERQLWVMSIHPTSNAPGVPYQVTAELGSSREPSWFTWLKPGDGRDPTEEIVFDGPGSAGDLDVHDVEAPLAPTPFGDPSLVTQWTMTGSAASDVHPTWSPRGHNLVFASDRPEGPGDAAGDFNLWVTPHDEAPDWLLTSGPGDDLHPAWQPRYNNASVRPQRPRGRAGRRRKAQISVVVPDDPGPGPGPGPGPAPQSERCTVKGTAGRDLLRGTPRADVICGLGGADRLFGRGGNDVLEGGNGPDELRGGAGRDRLEGGTGADRLLGGAGADRVIGGKGRDRAVRDRRDTVTQTERIRWP